MKPSQKDNSEPSGADGELRSDWTRHLQAAAGKRKSGDRFRPRFPEYHFTTALYIEQAIQEMETAVPYADACRTDGVRISCQIERLDSDRVHFKLAARRNGQVSAELVGSMQRWEGSLTRIDADVKTHWHGRWHGLGKILFVTILLVGIGAFILYLLASRQVLTSRAVVLPVAVVFAVLAVIWWAFFQDGVHRAAPSYSNSSVVEQDADDLIEILIATFNDDDVQWVGQ